MNLRKDIWGNFSGIELFTNKIKKNPYKFMIKNSFLAFLVSSCLTLMICFLNFLLSSFYISNTIIILEYCLGLIFWVILSIIPFLGFYFILKIPFSSVKIIELLQVPFEATMLVSLVFFILIAIIFFTFHSYGLILFLRENVFRPQFKVEYKNRTLILLILSIIIGVFFILTSDLIFFPIYQIIIIF